MNCGSSKDCARHDLVRSRVAWLLWCLPAVAILIAAPSDAARPWVWIPSLLVMGTACLKNAGRCGRLHCRFTGPLFLLGAVATFLDRFGVVAMHWRWTLAGLIAGTILAFALEHLRGRYGSGAV